MYKSCGSRFGGRLSDYPNWKQLLRSKMFPDYKLEVTVTVSTWANDDENATHYYVSFSVEADPLLILEDDEFREVVLWDHPKEYKDYRLNWDDAIPYSEIAESKDYDALKRGFTDPKFTLAFAQRIVR